MDENILTAKISRSTVCKYTYVPVALPFSVINCTDIDLSIVPDMTTWNIASREPSSTLNSVRSNPTTRSVIRVQRGEERRRREEKKGEERRRGGEREQKVKEKE